jgi:hypothetical protein
MAKKRQSKKELNAEDGTEEEEEEEGQDRDTSKDKTAAELEEEAYEAKQKLLQFQKNGDIEAEPPKAPTTTLVAESSTDTPNEFDENEEDDEDEDDEDNDDAEFEGDAVEKDQPNHLSQKMNHLQRQQKGTVENGNIPCSITLTLNSPGCLNDNDPEKAWERELYKDGAVWVAYIGATGNRKAHDICLHRPPKKNWNILGVNEDEADFRLMEWQGKTPYGGTLKVKLGDDQTTPETYGAKYDRKTIWIHIENELAQSGQKPLNQVTPNGAVPVNPEQKESTYIAPNNPPATEQTQIQLPQKEVEKPSD